MKKCSKCGIEKPLSEFQSNRASRDGKRPDCKECCKGLSRQYRVLYKEAIRERKKSYYERNKESIMVQHRDYIARNEDAVYLRHRAYREKNKEAIARWWSKSPRGRLLTTLRFALARHPTDNPVTIGQLMDMWGKQGGNCALSGIPMTWRQGKTVPTNVSIDRINSDLGYTVDNVQLVCFQFNTFKNRWSKDQMLLMARAIVDYNSPLPPNASSGLLAFGC